MLTSYRYTILPSPIEEWKAIKNKTELSGLKDAYLRDGVAYVRWMAWFEHKVEQGYDITEYEAAWRLTEYRRMGKYYRGLAYENISATGKNAGTQFFVAVILSVTHSVGGLALPHYTPHKSDEVMISRETPYLKFVPRDTFSGQTNVFIAASDSGGQYCDGTCDTTRTVHFGRPTADQAEAFTRVLQGHVNIVVRVLLKASTHIHTQTDCHRQCHLSGRYFRCPTRRPGAQGALEGRPELHGTSCCPSPSVKIICR